MGCNLWSNHAPVDKPLHGQVRRGRPPTPRRTGVAVHAPERQGAMRTWVPLVAVPLGVEPARAARHRFRVVSVSLGVQPA